VAEFSTRLKRLRQSHSWTQEELGKRINVTKVSISGYESGNRMPDIETLQRIADVFDVPIDYILGRTDVLPDEQELAARELPGWQSEDEIYEFVEWVKEEVGDTFFFDFKNTPEGRKEMFRQFMADQRRLWELERKENKK
jgi:transcriptional regulator with XRE-family HTH domain